MKAKKFLEIVKKSCTDENCELGKCPMSCKLKNHSSCLMMAAEAVPCDWDIDAIMDAVKKYKRGKKR